MPKFKKVAVVVIIDDLKNIGFYSNFNDAVKEALDFIKVNVSFSSEEKRYEIGDNIYAIVETFQHKKYQNKNLKYIKKYRCAVYY
ncbi:MAG: YhcH/YjgK/YiaL family protein [Endomicrobium sp.]|nr:YhcH/YjgK/YiaL family protein [Endomicrobium sp.]